MIFASAIERFYELKVGALLRRAKRARRERLRRKQPNQCNPTTCRLAAMNMPICCVPRRRATKTGIDLNFGKEPDNSFTQDQHPDLRADYVVANPPFNIKEWWDGKLEDDARWKYSTPPFEADLIECMVGLPGHFFGSCIEQPRWN